MYPFGEGVRFRKPQQNLVYYRYLVVKDKLNKIFFRYNSTDALSSYYCVG